MLSLLQLDTKTASQRKKYGAKENKIKLRNHFQKITLKSLKILKQDKQKTLKFLTPEVRE